MARDQGPSPRQRCLPACARAHTHTCTRAHAHTHARTRTHAHTCTGTHARARTPQRGLSTEHWVRRTLNPPQDATAPSWGGDCAVIKRLDGFSARLGSARAPHRRPLPRLFSSCVLLSARLGLRDQGMASPQEPPAAPAPLSAWQSARQPCRPGCRLRPVGASPCKHLHFVCGWRADESPAPQRGSAPGFRGASGRLPPHTQVRRLGHH